MERNLIFAVVLSSLVYIGWYSYLDKQQKKNPPPAAATTAQSADAPKQAQEQAARQAPASVPAAAVPAGQPLPPSSDWKKTAVEIKAGKSTFLFSPEHASLKSLVYQGPVAPVELIPDQGYGFFAMPLAAPYRLKARGSDYAEFASEDKSGLTVTKRFTLAADGGLGELKITCENKGRAALALPARELTLGPGLLTVESQKKDNHDQWRALYAYQEKDRKHPTALKIKAGQSAEAAPLWAGVDNRYFLAALAGPDLAALRPLNREGSVGGEEAPELVLPFPADLLNPGGRREWSAKLYFGPKDYPFLKTLGFGLDRSVDFGFFAPLAKLANSTLMKLHDLTGNFGAAIILLSLLLQVLLTPLSYKSYKAMAVMKKIQPEMQSIQKRYKDEPQRMNQEIMELYKRHGTNPLGGCLPMLLQLPVFFALFTALSNSWNLHGAPFALWIHDLSAKDPYYVLPLVMGALMFLQQHLTPQAGDPAQAAMMKWMPVIFTFMFLSFPSGLVMYWLINTIWGFAQNMYLQKKMA